MDRGAKQATVHGGGKESDMTEHAHGQFSLQPIIKDWSSHYDIRLKQHQYCKSTMCCAKPLQSCLIPCNPMDCNPSGSSVHGILQARILEWAAITFFRGIFPAQRVNLCLLCLLHWKAGSILIELPWYTST